MSETSQKTGLLSIMCVLGASLAFTLNDAGIKFLSGDYALHQIVLLRASVATLFTLAIFIPLDGGYSDLKTKRIGLHMLRGFMVVIANMSFFAGLAALTLADATALFFVAPIFITLFSALILNESVGFQRLVAVIIGLVGVIVMLRPGAEAFKLAGLLPVLAAFCYAMMQILTRKLGVSEKASTMAFYIQITFIAVSTTIGLTVGDGRYYGTAIPSLDFLMRAWVLPSTRDLLVMVGLGCLSAIGGYLISQAYRLSEAALIAPFEYFAMPVAIIWGVLFFNEWPDAFAWLGTALIAGAGLFIMWRETVNNKKLASQRPMPRHR